MASSCCFNFSPRGLLRSPHHHVPLRLLTTTTTGGYAYTRRSPARLPLRLIPPSPPPQKILLLPCPVSSSSDVAEDTPDEEQEWAASTVVEDEENRDERYGFEIEVRKLPNQKNRRLVRARVRVGAPLEAVWATLTDYEGLAGFIPGLSECRLLDQDAGFARLYQVGQQDLALGIKFNAKGTIDCYEGDMELLSAAGARRREIAFNMVEGDFKVFEGKWSVEEVDDSIDEAGDTSSDQEFQTTLSYVVELEPKLWVPVRLLEGRICNEIKTNLISIREEAERIQRLQGK